MVPGTAPTATVDGSRTGSRTLLNAVVGAVTAIILSFLPLSTLLGGAIAAYLEGGTPADGMRVGAIAGALMLVPFVLAGLTFGSFLFTGGVHFPMGGRPRTPFGIMAIFAVIVGAIYTVGLSIAGGYLGNYLRDEL